MTLTQIFDEEALCNPGTQGFFFADTTCTTFGDADLQARPACHVQEHHSRTPSLTVCCTAVQVEVQGYRGGYCWYSGSLSGCALQLVLCDTVTVGCLFACRRSVACSLPLPPAEASEPCRGAIAGVVIGSLIIFGLLCWCCFILVRRTRGVSLPPY